MYEKPRNDKPAVREAGAKVRARRARRGVDHRRRVQDALSEWVRRALNAPGVHFTGLTPDVAVDSSRLPEPIRGDPADRILIATARRTGAALVTRDREIVDYGRKGLLAVLDATP